MPDHYERVRQGVVAVHPGAALRTAIAIQKPGVIQGLAYGFELPGDRMIYAWLVSTRGVESVVTSDVPPFVR